MLKIEKNIIKMCELNTYGILGGKARVLFDIINTKIGVVTCGSRQSTQIKTVAEVCKKIGIPCHIFMPNGQSDSRLYAEQYGAIIHLVSPAYNTVLNARAREFATNNAMQFIPLGMLSLECIEKVTNIVLENSETFKGQRKIIIPIGGGCFFMGIVKALNKIGYSGEIMGVMCGMDATKNIYKFLTPQELENVKIVKSSNQYNKAIKNNFGLNETYEAKCLEYLTENDFLISIAK